MEGAPRLPLRFLAAGLGLLLALWFLRYALLPFIVAMLLAYLLAPLVDRLARHMRPSIAAGLTLAGTVGALAGLLRVLIPWLLLQGSRLLESLPHWQTRPKRSWAPGSRPTPGWRPSSRASWRASNPPPSFRGSRSRVAGSSGSCSPPSSCSSCR